MTLRSSSPKEGAELEQIRKLIISARQSQRQRNDGVLNSRIPPSRINELVRITLAAQELLEKAAEQFIITGRGYHRLLKVSRTIADLQHSETVDTPHVAEALQYRLIQD